jgi:hypothetical protein
MRQINGNATQGQKPQSYTTVTAEPDVIMGKCCERRKQ